MAYRDRPPAAQEAPPDLMLAARITGVAALVTVVLDWALTAVPSDVWTRYGAQGSMTLKIYFWVFYLLQFAVTAGAAALAARSKDRVAWIGLVLGVVVAVAHGVV